ncbi:MAG: ribonuclease R [Tepidisphaerales bacterium]
MSESIQSRILSHLQSNTYQPARPRSVARELEMHSDAEYPAFRAALRSLMDQGRVVLGQRGCLVLPTAHARTAGPGKTHASEFLGTYSHNPRGFGFVTPDDPTAKEDIFIPPGENGGALTGDKVRVRVAPRRGRERDGKALLAGKVVEVVERSNSRFVGDLAKVHGKWYVLPDGNALTTPIHVPDAGSRHLPAGTRVVVELTAFPDRGEGAVGVITDVLGKAGDKDVDLKSIIIQHNLPEDFPDEVKAEARQAAARFDPNAELAHRLDLTRELVVTIDPDDAKDYDDAISLRTLDHGRVELGVHIADVSHFVAEGSALDQEARKRGNSVYFPGHVIPMLPEILSNGVCSLQEGVPRLCLSAFITLDAEGKPVSTRFAETIISSARRLRYREAQDLIDGKAEIHHPDGPRRRSDYPSPVLDLLKRMDQLARKIQKRRLAAGQLVLDLPEVELRLDDHGRVVGTEKEDTSFTHTIIEMFMVEANEAVARLLDSLDIPFIRRVHPEPDLSDAERLSRFVSVAGHRLPKVIDRHAIQRLIAATRDRPEAYAINLAVLKSLTRAEYSPEREGHYALASEHYTHFTSPIRRYADLHIHRLVRRYLQAQKRHPTGPRVSRTALDLGPLPSFEDLVALGRHLSFTERRAEAAERELRQVKLLTLLQRHVGEDFPGVVTGITQFGIFVQLTDYLIDGLIRYEDLLDDWWDVDEQAGVVRGQRTGKRIGIGDTCIARIARVDPARRELALSITRLTGRVDRVQVAQDADDGDATRAKRRGKSSNAAVKGGGSSRPERKAASRSQARGGGHRKQSAKGRRDGMPRRKGRR